MDVEPTRVARQLTDELARTFDLPPGAQPVEMEGDGSGGIALARIDLSGARLDLERAMETQAAAHRPPDLTIARLEVKANPLTVEGAPVFLEGNAEQVGVALSEGPARLVTLKSGTASGHLTRSDLEAAVRSTARQLAKRYGVELEELDLQLASAEPRRLSGRVRVRAAKRVRVANVRTTVAGHASREARASRVRGRWRRWSAASSSRASTASAPG